MLDFVDVLPQYRKYQKENTKHIGKYVVQLDVGNGEAILCMFFSPVVKFVSFQRQRTKSRSWRMSAGGTKLPETRSFKDVGDPFGILLVGFLPANGLDVLRMRENDFEGEFQNAVDGNPVLPNRFHADVVAVIFGKPDRASPPIAGEGRKPRAFVAVDALVIGRRDAGDQKGFVDIHPTADRVNDSEHNTSPQNNI